MPTGRSWPEPGSAGWRRRATGGDRLRQARLQPGEIARGLADLRSLLRFRSSSLGRHTRRRLWIAAGVVLALSVAAAVVPAYLREPLDARRAGDLVALSPSLYLSFLVLAAIAAVAAGGGREIVPREEAVAFPVSPVTEHAAALLLAPLNIAWLLQTWTLLGVNGYVLGPHRLWASTLPVLLWIVAATAAGQVIGWVFEGIRRGPAGRWITRGVTGLLLLAATVVVATGRAGALLDASPTIEVYLTALRGGAGLWGPWARGVALLALAAVVLMLAGLVPGRWALGRPQREELRLESGRFEARPNPSGELAAMLRVDRASMWRSVPLRRGVAVLAVMPGLVALAGALDWDLITVLPGLVASGGALLFGVNSWCLDGRGALWRESLPGSSATGFYAKAIVLVEVLLAAAVVTLVLAGIRAGTPTPAEVAAALGATLVVPVQVAVISLRWSIRQPYAVDLRSARATPAPPVVMAGYSARLAVRTTITGLVFSWAAHAPDWWGPALLAVALLCWSGFRLSRLAGEWALPPVRSRVIATVAA